MTQEEINQALEIIATMTEILVTQCGNDTEREILRDELNDFQLNLSAYLSGRTADRAQIDRVVRAWGAPI